MAGQLICRQPGDQESGSGVALRGEARFRDEAVGSEDGRAP